MVARKSTIQKKKKKMALSLILKSKIEGKSEELKHPFTN